ncbi:MAG: hypothetical protein HYX99_00845 [Chloroflexi bacterium]|nr:hypothetical protein [Chloroflexota bacterium]
MSISRLLYSLQERDLTLDFRREALRETELRLADESALLQAQQELEDSRGRLSRLERDLREAEGGAEDLRSKVLALEDKLYSGKVGNPKELLALQEETRNIKSLLRKQEDRALELMLQVDAARESVAQLRGTFQDVTQKRQIEREDLMAQRAALEEEIAALEAERRSLIAGVEARDMDLYSRLRTSRQGKAVAKVEGGMCQGCRISLPTHFWQQARMGSQLVQCTSCSRILYVS